MASFYARNGAGELLARYSFIEPLLEGRRVLEIGAARASAGTLRRSPPDPSATHASRSASRR